MLFVLPEQLKSNLVQSLLQLVKRLRLRIDCLYLDKGFCEQTVIAYLKSSHYPVIIACPIRGKQAGTRALCHGRKSYFTTYTFGANTPQAYAVRLAVVRTYKTRHGKRSATWCLYVIIGLKVRDPNTIRARYRARFGIESSYRCMRQTHAKTTSRNPLLRFFLLGVAFLILNLWVTLRWHFCQIPRRGGRLVCKKGYELQRHCRFIRRAIEQLYDALHVIHAQVAPLQP
jgi:putative transposase